MSIKIKFAGSLKLKHFGIVTCNGHIDCAVWDSDFCN